MFKKLKKWLQGESINVEDLEPFIPKWEAIDWQPVVEKIKDQVENHLVYLYLNNDSYIKVEEFSQESSGPEVIGVAVAYPLEDVKPWDTEAPAKHMQEKLGVVLERDVLLLINRKPEFSAGYFVCIANT